MTNSVRCMVRSVFRSTDAELTLSDIVDELAKRDVVISKPVVTTCMACMVNQGIAERVSRGVFKRTSLLFEDRTDG